MWLAHGFHARRHEVILLTFRPGGALWDTVEGAEVRALQPFDTRLDWFAPALSARIRAEQPDVVLAMGRMANCHLGFLAAPLHRRAAALPGVAIATYRTGKPLPWLYRRTLRLADHVVANSHEAADVLRRRHGRPAERVSVIYNSLHFPPPPEAAEETGLAARRRELRARSGATDGTQVLLCVAMFRPEKNQKELVEIASGLPAGSDWQLWLAGDGPSRRACEARVAELKLKDRVRFLGFTPDPAPLYAAADAAVHASWSEALSNFLIESQAHGLPAVAYDAQGVSECFAPGETGWLIRRDDREAFRAALGRLFAEPSAARASRSAAARTFARARFDSASQIEAYLRLFQRLLG